MKRVAACVGKKAATTESELAQRTGWPAWFRSRACHKSKMACDFDGADLRNFQRAQLQFLRDCPMRNEADAEPGLDRRLDSFRRIQVNDFFEGLKFEASLLKSRLDHTAGTRTLFAHEEV